jgi:hypothetical protein
MKYYIYFSLILYHFYKKYLKIEKYFLFIKIKHIYNVLIINKLKQISINYIKYT